MGEKGTWASDQYSLGIVLYEILTGSKPYHQENTFHAQFQHVKAKPESMVEKESRISPQLEAAILRMLEKKPEDRFASMAQARDTIFPMLEFVTWQSKGSQNNIL